MRILIMKGQSQYGGTRLFADLAALAFARRGAQVEVMDLGTAEQAGASAAAMVVAHAPGPAPYDFIFTINIAAELRDSQGRSLRELYGCPHVLWLTDYALRQAARRRATPRDTAVLVVDPTQIDAVHAIYGEDRFDYIAFFPHPAVGEPAPDDTTVGEFVDRRPIEVLWSGGFQKPGVAWKDVVGPARQLLQDALDLSLSVEWMPPHEALDTVMASRGLDLMAPEIRQAREAAALVDIEVRMTRRFEFLKGLAKLGLPLRIVGAGWEGQLYRFKNATYEGPVEMTRMVELMRQSRVVLNTNGNFGGGSHERPFSASLAGAATFSDFSRYYGQVFEAGKNIEFFYWKDLAGGLEKLAALVAEPERAFSYAQSAKALTVAGHTWDRRIDLIFAAAEAVRSR